MSTSTPTRAEQRRARQVQQVITLAELDANPAAALIASAQTGPTGDKTRGQHIASCLAYAELQPDRIAAEIERLHHQHTKWEEAVPILRRLLAKENDR